MSDLGPILLAEDNENDVELMLEALEDLRLANELVVVNDGAQALDFLYRRGAYASRTSANPVVVLLDLKMPKVDGFEVLREVKSKSSLKTIPVVILTSSREEQDLVQSHNLGVNAYVVKPIDFHQFTEAVKQVGAFWAILNEPPPSFRRNR